MPDPGREGGVPQSRKLPPPEPDCPQVLPPPTSVKNRAGPPQKPAMPPSRIIYRTNSQ